MEDLFSTVFTLIPLAIFIGVRMIASKKKQAAVDERKKLADMLSRAVASPEPARAILADDDFDAHALRPDEEEPKAAPKPAPKPVPPAKKPKPPRPPAFPELRPTAYDILPAEAPRAAPSAAPAAKAEAVSEARRAFSERVDALPPLKKAVVFSELLGPPSSIKES